MSKCFLSFTEFRSRCLRSTYTKSGLKSTTTDLKDGTVIHSWIPKTPSPTKPNLLLIHGFGSNAMWQWANLICHLAPHFNLYVPDLVFFGGSYTTRPERFESFQAECLMRALRELKVGKVSVVGMSYGGFPIDLASTATTSDLGGFACNRTIKTQATI
uniref:AB hydrolase-1 domain-containing protein n=1 Tax=Kalanchoe fedtschenkoi TaxID=63787 RepID=A0A7N0ULG4_KALFE